MMGRPPMSLDQDNRFNKLYENSYEAIVLLDPSLEILYRSRSAEQITGWKTSDLLGVAMKDLIHEDDFAHVSASLHQVLAQPGLFQSCNFQLLRSGGKYMWLECSFTNMLDDEDIQAIVCHYKDITQIKKADQLLLQTNQRLDTYKHALDEASIVAVTDRRGIITHVNDNFCRISKYERSELMGQDHRIINSSFHDKEFIRNLWEHITAGRIWKGELKNKAKDGSYYWVDTTIVPFLDEYSKPYKYVAIRSDITARKLIEEKLILEQRHLRLLESVITNTRDAILITEAEVRTEPGPRILYVNEAFTRMTGYSSEEVLGKSPRFLHGPETNRTELNRLGQALLKWESCEITVINYKKNGDPFWNNITVTPVADEFGQYTHIIAVDHDITEKINLEKEYDQIFHNAPDIICTVGIDGYFKKINPALSKILEYSEAELLAGSIVSFIHPGDRMRVMAELEIRNKGEESFYFENRCVTKTGQVKWLGWTSTPATEDGLIFTVAKNITEKKELEDLLDKVTRLAGIGGWMVDLIQDTVYWSDITREIHEVNPGYEPSLQTGLDFYKEESGKMLISEQLKFAIEKGLSFDVELQINTTNQHVKWVRVIGEPEFENGKCVRIRGSFQDIDVRKRAELAVIEGFTEKNIILESIGDAFFAVDRNWTVNYWNNKAEKVLYKTRQQTIGHNLWTVFSDAIGSESYKKYHLAIQTKQAVHFEDYYPPLLKWYDISAYPSDNGLSVYFKDITERKKIRSALEESERNYSALFHLSPLPMWVFDLETLSFLDTNAAAIKNYGYSRSEFLAMTIMDIRPVEDIVKVQKIIAIKNSVTQKLIHLGAFSHKKKSGELIQVEIQSNLIRYKGRPAKIVIANDMTKSYNHTKKIEAQNAKLREIAWMQSHVVRAPLARIMGIVPMVKDWEAYADERETLLDYLLQAANELDDVIKSISDKTSII